MSASTRRLSMIWMATLVVAGAFGVMLAGGQGLGQPAQAAVKTKGEAQLDVVVSIPALDGASKSQVVETLRSMSTFRVDSFFDIEYRTVYRGIGSSGQDGVRYAIASNIGSSGQDGVRSSVDSFFDIFLFGDAGVQLPADPSFDIFGDPDFDLLRVSARGTLADPTNPGLVLDELDRAMKGKGHEHRGHVSVLR